MKGIWKDNEVKDLFCEVENSAKKGESLKCAFSRHAEKYKRANGSVRNYYYHEVDRLKDDKVRAERLCIDLDKHNKACIKYFSSEEENEFFERVKSMTDKGMSVRKACLSLAGGEDGKMLRYQNKYRALCKKKREVPDNIIPFAKKSSAITDSEIQALFAGLVRLVKRSAQEEAEMKIKEREERANRELRKTLALLGERDREIEKIKSQFLSIKKENENLLKGMRENACFRAKLLKEMPKMGIDNKQKV